MVAEAQTLPASDAIYQGNRREKEIIRDARTVCASERWSWDGSPFTIFEVRQRPRHRLLFIV